MAVRAYSIFLIALLIGGVLWGQCAYCPPSGHTASDTHACCRHHHGGNCKVPAQKTQAKCPNLALVPAAHHPTHDAGPVAALPLVAAAATVSPVRSIEEPAPAVCIAHGPPGLYLLNSTLLI